MVIISDMDVDLSRELDIRVTSVFSPTEVYFPPYSVTETFQILKSGSCRAVSRVLSDKNLGSHRGSYPAVRGHAGWH